MQINRGRYMTRTRGFSLIELLVVVAIIAILAAIAVPAYGRYGYRARRADGQELLLRIANAQERYYATYNKFGALADLGYSDPALSERGYYQVTLTGLTSSVYTAEAAPNGVQANDVCNTLTITSTGAKTPSAGDATSNSNGSCW
jgi:type IV pilus assembly protein PilE